MHKFQTRAFTKGSIGEIDAWLNDGIGSVPASIFNALVVGYVVLGDLVVITKLVFDAREKSL